MVTDAEGKNEWVTLKIPAKLAAAVDEVLPETTFNNRNRFCEDAVREKLERTKQDIEDRADSPATAE